MHLLLSKEWVWFSLFLHAASVSYCSSSTFRIFSLIVRGDEWADLKEWKHSDVSLKLIKDAASDIVVPSNEFLLFYCATKLLGLSAIYLILLPPWHLMFSITRTLDYLSVAFMSVSRSPHNRGSIVWLFRWKIRNRIERQTLVTR